jgi:hypothetical protein
MIAWVAVAFAGPLELGLGGGVITNRVVQTAGSFDASLAVFPDPIVGVDLRGSVGVRPPLQGHQTLVARCCAEGELVVSVPWSAALTVQFAPLPAEAAFGRFATDLRPYVLAGPGVVRTFDDFTENTPYGEARFESTRAQLHPTLVIGGGLRIGSGPWAARLQADSARWVEVVHATDLEIVSRASFSAALVASPVRSERR